MNFEELLNHCKETFEPNCEYELIIDRDKLKLESSIDIDLLLVRYHNSVYFKDLINVPLSVLTHFPSRYT